MSIHFTAFALIAPPKDEAGLLWHLLAVNLRFQRSRVSDNIDRVDYFQSCDHRRQRLRRLRRCGHARAGNLTVDDATIRQQVKLKGLPPRE